MTATLRGMFYRGVWNSGSHYAIEDMVQLGGVSYVAVAANTNDSPPSASWATLGGLGSQGYQGFQGSQGVQGNQGFQGRQGAQGTGGPQGAQGPLGVGAQGTQGVQGNQGSQGAFVGRSSLVVSYAGTPSISPFVTILELDHVTMRVARTQTGVTETPAASGFYEKTISGSALSGGDFIVRFDEGNILVYNEEVVLVP